MDVVPPAGAVCARLVSEAKKRADTATTLAVITNAKRWPVKPDFDGMVDSSLSDTRQHSVDLANELVQRTVGERPVIVVNFISSYSSQFTSVNRATGRPVAPSTSFMVMPRPPANSSAPLPCGRDRHPMYAEKRVRQRRELAPAKAEAPARWFSW